MKRVVHVDGASRGNPGPAAIGVVITDAHWQVLEEIGEHIGETTNNVAEYRALIRALMAALAQGAM
jgi:ribonuclease HI